MSLEEFEQKLANDINYNLALTLTHSQFVDGMKNKELQYNIIGEPSTILNKNDKKIFSAYVIIYLISPLILVPVLSFYLNNWWLLFGILFSYAGTLSSSWKTHLPAYLVLYFIGEAIAGHWHFKDYDDFFYICLLWGWFWFQVAEEGQNQFSMEALMKDEKLYNLVVENRKIIVSKRDI